MENSNRGLELYWDFSSPFAYLASTQAEALAARTGAELAFRPMLLGAVFKAVGQDNVPLFALSEAKRRYVTEDMFRWARFWDVPLAWPSRFPMNSVKALRCYLALDEAARTPFMHEAFHAYWAEDRDIASDEVLADLIGDQAREVLEKTQTQPVKDALFAATQRALDAGVFGAPTWVVDGRELYWGQDRVPLVERALTR